MSGEGNLLDVLGLIALRKSEMYSRVIKVGVDRGIDLDKERVKQMIADTDNAKFISDDEKKSKVLNTKTKLDSLKIDIGAFLISKQK